MIRIFPLNMGKNRQQWFLNIIKNLVGVLISLTFCLIFISCLFALVFKQGSLTTIGWYVLCLFCFVSSPFLFFLLAIVLLLLKKQNHESWRFLIIWILLMISCGVIEHVPVTPYFS